MNNRINRVDGRQNKITNMWLNRFALCSVIVVGISFSSHRAQAQELQPLPTDPIAYSEIQLSVNCVNPTIGCGSNTWVAPSTGDVIFVATVAPGGVAGVTLDANRPHKQCAILSPAICWSVRCALRSVYSGTAASPGRFYGNYTAGKQPGCS